MPKMNAQKVTVKSKGFALWKQYEAIHGRISMGDIAKDTGLGASTVQKLIAKPDIPINQAAILGIAVLAKFFGVGIDDFISVSEDEGR